VTRKCQPGGAGRRQVDRDELCQWGPTD